MNDRFQLPPSDLKRSFVSRAGLKLEAAVELFHINCAVKTCADLGANVGGFTDCLLQHGAAKVYAVDTGYGVLAWTLRKDPRVVVMERHNALHAELPEPVDIVAIDTGWTRQQKILPAARKLLKPAGEILTLIKPHYESAAAATAKNHGVLAEADSIAVLHRVAEEIEQLGFIIRGIVKSPIEGQKGNVEFVAWLGR
jgi:23S rRNA (cytidine1920-2'-O)/16S rRNA (cytidine1409-2'-O)-methyltransferase